MKNHNRLYSAALTILVVLTTVSAGLLFFLAGASAGGAIETKLPDWSLPWVAVVNLVYAIAIAITLCARRLHPEKGRRFSRILNWLLLPAIPGGTIVGLYGLLKVDRRV